MEDGEDVYHHGDAIEERKETEAWFQGVWLGGVVVVVWWLLCGGCCLVIFVWWLLFGGCLVLVVFMVMLAISW